MGNTQEAASYAAGLIVSSRHGGLTLCNIKTLLQATVASASMSFIWIHEHICQNLFVLDSSLPHSPDGSHFWFVLSILIVVKKKKKLKKESWKLFEGWKFGLWFVRKWLLTKLQSFLWWLDASWMYFSPLEDGGSTSSSCPGIISVVCYIFCKHTIDVVPYVSGSGPLFWDGCAIFSSLWASACAFLPLGSVNER